MDMDTKDKEYFELKFETVFSKIDSVFETQKKDIERNTERLNEHLSSHKQWTDIKVGIWLFAAGQLILIALSIFK